MPKFILTFIDGADRISKSNPMQFDDVPAAHNYARKVVRAEARLGRYCSLVSIDEVTPKAAEVAEAAMTEALDYLREERLLPTDVTDEQVHLYGPSNPNHEHIIHEREGRFFVHAWWYAPIGYDTLEEAEAKRYP